MQYQCTKCGEDFIHDDHYPWPKPEGGICPHCHWIQIREPSVANVTPVEAQEHNE